MMRQVHAFFSGNVQGVGFRATADHIARELPVTGFVRNLRGGKVELVIEGDEEILENFLQRLRRSFLSKCIYGMEVRWLEATGIFQDFSIRYSL
ncbi:MAG: acylphosphatase [Chlamydiae bacterium]|nr:acylphosphatase [Chlamydiota bacterium]MBI3278158.1 acylphosphatase [Chlamydiota bacterium]